MRPTGSTFYYFFFILLLFSSSYAQVFPVQGNLQITPPYSPYLSDYTAAGTQKITLQLRSNDIALSDHPIRLRFSIEGVGISIRTKPGYIPPAPHTLMGGGAPTLFYGEDLLDYFSPDNLDFAGFSRSDFQKSAKLPEGVYRFSFEVFDYYRQVPLSSKITMVTWIVLNDPPLLNLPLNQAKVSLIDPVNIAFTWTPRHTASPNAAFSTEYVFKLVEIWPANRNPYDAFLSQNPLYETTVNESQLVYGPAEPALITGRKYAWQVQARDENGRDIFKNQGKSEVFVFQFGDGPGIPENLHKQSGNTQTLTLLWEAPARGVPDQYNIRYKTAAENKWSETLSDQPWVTLTSLQANTDYDVQVRSKREDLYSDYTAALRVKTDEKAREFTCGQPPPAPTKPDKTSRLLQLTPGDVFTCSDWRIVVIEAIRSANGEYAGKGMMAVKMFNGASVEVVFHGAINAGYQLITGGVESTYKKDSEMGAVVEEMHKIGEKKKDTTKTAIDTTAVTPITFPGIIDSVYFDKDKKEVVVVDKEGKKTSYPQKTDPKTKEARPMQITDAAGNTVTVGKDGTVTKGAAGGAGGNSVASTNPQLNILMKEILASFTKDIDDYLVKKPPVKKGPTADLYDDYLSKPDCLPDDAEALHSIKAYSNELQTNSDQLDQFVNTILKKEENRTYFNDLVKNTLDDYKQKKSYKEALSAKEYKKVREIICPYLVEGESDIKKFAEFQQIVLKGKECSNKLDSAYLRGMRDGIIDRSASTFKTLTSAEGWKNILSGGCVLLYHVAYCINPAKMMSKECKEFYTTLAEAAEKYAEGLLQEDCYKRGYAWGEMIVDALGIEGLTALAKGTIKIGTRLIKATNVETKLAPVIKTTVEGGGDAAKGGTTVLGKYPDYTNLAGELGAKRFNIPTNIWNKMTAAEQWAANTRFLDRMIARGDKIVLSNRVTDINKVTGAFRKELDYLISKGYRLSSDGLQMIK